ncbi:MAG: SUMF1/EgtB/PvdO family nonheme iron enzyme [Chitinophagaceae bacterium]|nr:SUMF1/EgtB/PvdO family nonheme iron enzyme [Chitinophagaceae bacterium]
MPGKNSIVFIFYVSLFANTIVRSQTVSLANGDPFVRIAAGSYQVGKKDHTLNPVRKVVIEEFFIATTETTNKQFQQFVSSTSYVTDAEKKKNAMVFSPGLREYEWIEDSTANWRYPNGISRGGIDNKGDHPVTCISYTDIMAYCRWAEVRLPSLQEWEIACRAGSTTDYFFGNDAGNIKYFANTWLGRNHLVGDSSDGYMYTSPVGSFKPNSWGLYDMYGNVFEFCTGKLKPNQKDAVVHARGGSWWCSKTACRFYNSYDIGRVNIHASFSNQGFRVVKL